jgi:hypothetical protein
MIAFRPLVRANPSRPSPDQAARIPSPPLPSPPATQSHPRGGATENPPIPPIPCSASITSPADRPRCCRPEADRSISLTARWLLLASLTPHQIPDGRCSPRSLARSLPPSQIPAPPLAAQFRSAASRSIHPSVLSQTTGARRGSAAAGAVPASRMAALAGATGGADRGARRRRRPRRWAQIGGDGWGRACSGPAPGSPRELRHLPSPP